MTEELLPLPPGGVVMRAQTISREHVGPNEHDATTVSISVNVVTRHNEIIHAGRLSVDARTYRETLAPVLRIAAKREPRLYFEE